MRRSNQHSSEPQKGKNKIRISGDIKIRKRIIMQIISENRRAKRLKFISEVNRGWWRKKGGRLSGRKERSRLVDTVGQRLALGRKAKVARGNHKNKRIHLPLARKTKAILGLARRSSQRKVQKSSGGQPA